jgi:hypothetical protein
MKNVGIRIRDKTSRIRNTGIKLPVFMIITRFCNLYKKLRIFLFFKVYERISN